MIFPSKLPTTTPHTPTLPLSSPPAGKAYSRRSNLSSPPSKAPPASCIPASFLPSRPDTSKLHGTCSPLGHSLAAQYLLMFLLLLMTNKSSYLSFSQNTAGRPTRQDSMVMFCWQVLSPICRFSDGSSTTTRILTSALNATTEIAWAVPKSIPAAL